MEENNESKNQIKILVIEDDQLLRDLLVRKLSKEGFAVSNSVDAKSAFREMEREKPDLILLDLILPGVNGFGILEKVKSDDGLAHIPVLILSNLGQEEDINRVMELGAYGFLVKANFTLDEIIVRVHKVLLGESID